MIIPHQQKFQNKFFQAVSDVSQLLQLMTFSSLRRQSLNIKHRNKLQLNESPLILNLLVGFSLMSIQPAEIFYKIEKMPWLVTT